MRIKVNPKSLSTGEAVVITQFVGFGDLLYHTPTLRIMSRIYKGVDVWCFNPEPFYNNPYINKVFKLDKDLNLYPQDFYFNFIFHASAAHNPFIESIYPSNVYSPEYYSLALIHSSLPNEEKHLTFNWLPKDIVSVKTKAPVFNQNKIITVINPAIGWPSRTLPYDYYKKLIDVITSLGDIVILTGKEINPKSFIPTLDDNNVLQKNENKSLYPLDEFLQYENVVDLTNKLSFAECAALYSLADIAINTENGNMVISGTHDNCWNLYIPTLTAPQYRIPYRHGSQEYRTTIVHNDAKYYPGSDFKQLRQGYDYVKAEVQLPHIDKIIEAYKDCRETIVARKIYEVKNG